MRRGNVREGPLPRLSAIRAWGDGLSAAVPPAAVRWCAREKPSFGVKRKDYKMQQGSSSTIDATAFPQCADPVVRVLLASPAGSALHDRAASIEAAGHTVTLVDSLAGVQNRLENDRYDVVVVDSSLPDWSPPVLKEWCSGDADSAPIVVVADDPAALREKFPDIEQTFYLSGVTEAPAVAQLAGTVTAAARRERELRAMLSTLNTEAEQRARNLEAAHARAEKNYRELQQAHSQLLQTEKMASIGQLAAGVAHEINNPIGFIYSNMNTLRDYVVDIREFAARSLSVQECLQKGDVSAAEQLAHELDAWSKDNEIQFVIDDIETLVSETIDGAERVKRIVTDLRTFSRAEEDHKTTADINKGLESTVNVCWNELKYHCEVIKDLGDIPEIDCYPSKLNQVFMNLIINAAQSIEGKGTVTIRTRYEDGYVVVEISDTGCGIPKENLDKIFDPFFTTKPVGKGTGLGLSIAYNIVAEHDGELSVESEVGRGTTFTVKLPTGEQNNAR